MNHQLYSQIIEALDAYQPAVLQQQFNVKYEGGGILKLLVAKEDPAFHETLYHGCPMVSTENDIVMLREPFFPADRMIVLGGGHIAVPLVHIAAMVGFSVTVIDDRPAFANVPRFPSAAGVICESFEKVFDRLGVSANDYVVVITRGHRHDMACLKRLQQGPEPCYVGMIGSRRRVSALKEVLIEEGCDADRINRTHTPIGLAIGAVTPPEIAISIMAEIIACKRLQDGKVNHARSSDVDMQVLRLLAEEKNVPKAIVTVISAKGSVPRGPGAKMLVYFDRRVVGSIGGGCSEAAVINIAQQMIGTGGYCLHTVDMTAEIAEEEGMVCGGVMQVLIEDYLV